MSLKASLLNKSIDFFKKIIILTSNTGSLGLFLSVPFLARISCNVDQIMLVVESQLHETKNTDVNKPPWTWVIIRPGQGFWTEEAHITQEN